MSRLAIVVPTVPGREQDLDRCIGAYRRTAPGAKIYIERDHTSCGLAWNAGAKRAARDGFDYLHLTADDLEPHEGWLVPAIAAVSLGRIPCPLVYRPDGTLESAGLAGFSLNGVYTDGQPVDGTTVPFLTREMWDAIGMIDAHYCTDLWVSAVGRLRGWETVVMEAMRFTHYTAPAGRNYGRAGDDTAAYLRALEEVTARCVS